MIGRAGNEPEDCSLSARLPSQDERQSVENSEDPLAQPVAAELAVLHACSIHDLRERWRALFRTEPPPAFGPDLLRRSIAQKLQEDAYGKLSSAVQRELNHIVAALERKPTAKIVLPRRIKPGSVLVREWKAKTHRVTVLDNGFSYDGRAYPSLSEIARAITGTRWNGPKFFGLRPADRSSDEQPINPAPPRRGRPRKSSPAIKPSTTTGASHGL